MRQTGAKKAVANLAQKPAEGKPPPSLAKLQSLLLEERKIFEQPPQMLELHEKKRKGTYFA
jgi:hypothetical protein